MSPVQAGLLDQNTIDITGKIGDETAFYVRGALQHLTVRGSPPIKVVISSEGGNFGAGLAIYDMLRFYTGHKTAIVNGFAHSSAVFIVQACDTRQCMRHATIVIHNILEPEMSLSVLRDPKKLRETLEDMEKAQARGDAILMARTKRTAEEIATANNEEKRIYAEEALAFGLVDEII